MNNVAHINKVVRSAIPKGKPVRILWHETGAGKSRILRVITPAWKTLPRSERNLRVEQVISAKLNDRDRAQIFRVSVLTGEEFNLMREWDPVRYGRPRSSGNGSH
jgi:ABC-type phosphate/phosphonate transport system ATPase subunit